MPSDQQVSTKAVMTAMLHVNRVGARRTLEELEQVEPDLAEYLMETLGQIHQRLFTIGATHAQSRRLSRDIEVMALVCITALRRGHLELWQGSDAGKVFEADASATPSSSGDAPSSSSAPHPL